jgi:hypothetical protein
MLKLGTTGQRQRRRRHRTIVSFGYHRCFDLLDNPKKKRKHDSKTWNHEATSQNTMRDRDIVFPRSRIVVSRSRIVFSHVHGVAQEVEMAKQRWSQKNTVYPYRRRHNKIDNWWQMVIGLSKCILRVRRLIYPLSHYLHRFCQYSCKIHQYR